MRKNENWIQRRDNTLSFSELAGPECFTSFQKCMYDGTKEGHTDFILDFSNTGGIFPEAAVPIAAYLELYRNEGIGFETRNARGYLVTSRFMSPLGIDSARYRDSNHPLAKVWKFTESAHVASIVRLLVDALAAAHVCAAGVLEGFEWCLNEVMDNVLQHSEGSPGYVMMQVHRDGHQMSVCIADHGQGILNSLRPSKYHPTSALNAITLAMKPGVTRDPSIGQGNGLWGLSEIVRLNEARLNLTSGPAALFFNGESTKTYEHLPFSWVRPGTAVAFRLNTNRQVDVSAALGGGNYTFVNLRMESLETPEGDHCILVQSISHGTGTRRSGLEVRNYVLNMFEGGAYRVILDFADVGMISSSFADEVIGKLVVHFGFSRYCQKVILKNVNRTIQPLIDRAVTQRIVQTSQETSVPGEAAKEGGEE